MAAPHRGQRSNQQLLLLLMQHILGEPPGHRFLRREQEPTQPQLRDEECSTEVVATIAGGYTEGMTRSAWKAQLRSAQQVLTTEQGPRTTVPTMDCLKKLTHPGGDIVLLVHPILDFGGQEVNPTGMICLPVCFDDKLKSKNLEVDFLVVDVLTAYNMILGCPTLHKRRWYRVVSPSSLRHSATALTPQANASTIVTSSSVILGESEVPKVTKSQDLTKSWTSENLIAGSALMKLVDGCWTPMGEPPTA
ncbi:hypothetical protein Cgig2_006764 [Carnegiea gigantea]|uniref:Uncharacterized protein n=1 Tax=Carnegiea gigantea TaxID=171969 RepID=A0A9Q1GPZ9_9CARY|nr:hypothetical protein Cgig2_006764 [Carnegiea gigantea]